MYKGVVCGVGMFFFSSRRRHTRCALVTGVQTCALPISETFVAIKAFVDNWRWKGVPFYIRTGKRLPNRQSEILIQFKNVPHSIFATKGKGLEPNTLLIRLQPEENIRLLIMAKQPGLDREGVELREVGLKDRKSTRLNSSH